MFGKNTIKGFMGGFITYFVLSFILDLFELDSILVKSIIVVILLIIYFIIQSHKENKKSWYS